MKIKTLLLVTMIFFQNTIYALTNGQKSISGKYREVVKIESLSSPKILGSGVFIDRETILTTENLVASNSPESVLIDGKASVLLITRPKIKQSKIHIGLVLLKVKPSASSQDFFPLAQKLPKTKSKVLLIGHGETFNSSDKKDHKNETMKNFGHNYIFDISQESIQVRFKENGYNPKEPSGAVYGDFGGPMVYNDEVIGIATKTSNGSTYYVNLLNSDVLKFIELNR